MLIEKIALLSTFSLQIKYEQIVKWHLMPIAAKDKQVLVEHEDARMAITSGWSLAPVERDGDLGA